MLISTLQGRSVKPKLDYWKPSAMNCVSHIYLKWRLFAIEIERVRSKLMATSRFMNGHAIKYFIKKRINKAK